MAPWEDFWDIYKLAVSCEHPSLLIGEEGEPFQEYVQPRAVRRGGAERSVRSPFDA